MFNATRNGVSELYLHEPMATSESPQQMSEPPVPQTSWCSTTSSEPIISSEHIVERISSRRLPGEARAHTVPELKASIGHELMGFAMQNVNLATAIFPDTSIPFAVDAGLIKRLLPPGTSPHETRQANLGLKSILLNPPANWTEKDIADWLNSIGTALKEVHPELGTYHDLDDKQVTIPKRTWTPKYHGNVLHGSPTKRKPDVILVDEGDKSRAIGEGATWQKVHAFSEVTITERKNSKTLKDTIRQKSYLMLTSRADRCFTVCLDFAHDSFTLTAIDRASLVYSETLKVVENPCILLQIIVGLMFGRPSDIGYDETIECGEDGKAISIMVGGKKYKVEEELFRSEALRGRATRCWRVSRSEGGILEEFVVKDSWVDTRRTQSEIVTLQRIHMEGICDGKGIPRLIHGEDVHVPTGAFNFIVDSTARRRVAQTDEQVEERVHRRLLMGPVGIRITNFRSRKELIRAFIDVVESKCHLFIINGKYTNSYMFSARKIMRGKDLA
jgi:hypothetical protein